MKKLLFFTLLLTTSLTASISAADVSITGDVVYGHKDGMALIYDVLRPEKQNGAAIAYMMSGGWFSRWRDPNAMSRIAQDMLDDGFVVMLVYHGSSPRYHVPDAYADVSRAIRHIRQNAASYGVDPDRIGVTGGSAGGHLSLMLGLAADDGVADAEDELLQHGNKVAAVVAYYPPVDLRPMADKNSKRFPALNFPAEQAASVSPILHVDAADPPTLLIHGTKDTLVPISNSEKLIEALSKHEVVSDFISLPGAGHGFRDEQRTQASKARLDWFRKHLL